jgi:hypothetical protein
LNFQIVKGSYELKKGTIQCLIKCPFIGCKELCKVSYKAYKTSYKPKIKSATSQSLTPARWHLYTIEKHLKRCHCHGAEDLDDETSNDLNRNENQNEDSQNGLENETSSRDNNQDLSNSPSVAGQSDEETSHDLNTNENQNEVSQNGIENETSSSRTRLSKKRAFPSVTDVLVKRTRIRK